MLKYYHFNGARVAMRQGSSVYYLHSDHLGTASLTTDANGAVKHQVRHYPFGGQRWSSGSDVSDYDFTGQRLDGFGLHDYNARYYDSVIGRFISADTVVPDFANPQDLNRYSYVVNNPLKFVDPDGHCRGLAGASYNACVKVVTALAPAVHQANEYREDIFFPDENTTFGDRLEASIAVGGGATLVSAIAAGGLAVAGTEAVAVVSTSSATALTGSAVGAGGNLAGQAINKAATGGEIDYEEAVIAGATGYIAGGLAPFAATTSAGAMALGGVSSTGQYALTQTYNGSSITPEGVLLNATAGAAFGRLAGPVPPRASNAALPFSEFANNPALRNRAIMEMYRGQLAETLTRSGIARMGIGATGTNLDWSRVQE